MDTVLLFELEAPLRCPLAEVDLAEARRVFASLMDRALPEIQALRLDQDEVLLERYVEVCDRSESAGGSVVFRLAAIGERGDWVRAYGAHFKSAGIERREPGNCEIMSLRLRVVRETSVPIFNPFDSSSPDA